MKDIWNVPTTAELAEMAKQPKDLGDTWEIKRNPSRTAELKCLMLTGRCRIQVDGKQVAIESIETLRDGTTQINLKSDAKKP